MFNLILSFNNISNKYFNYHDFKYNYFINDHKLPYIYYHH